jgi:ribonuclease P protein component
MSFDISIVLPKKYRLQDYQEIERIKKEGQLYQSPLFGLLIYQKTDHSPSRFCFVVSTKVSKKSTQRNYLKRIYSEALKPILIKIKPGYDNIFLLKKNSLGKKMEEINRELIVAFTKNSLLKSESN